jgi:hypothetical protein
MTIPREFSHTVHPELDEQLSRVLASIERMPEGMRQAVIDGLWGSIPETVDERLSQVLAAAAPGNALTVPAQTGGLELITCIIAAVPTGSTGVLQLGSTFQLPLVAGVTALPELRCLLQSTDVRQLTIAGGAGGLSALWLMGKQLPTYGVLAH